MARQKFPMKLSDLFKGSLSQENPLKSFRWMTEPSSLSIRMLKGEWNGESGVLRLSFDIGIQSEIQGVLLALKNRGRKCDKPCQFGFGAQYAYYHYLNFFSEQSPFRFTYDDVFGSRFSLPSDFRIIFPDHKFWLEVKTALPNMKYIRYYITKYTRYPEYVVSVKCLDEEMLNYELYGCCTGLHIQKTDLVSRYGKQCHEIPLNRENFRDYAYFHSSILKLPFMKKFDSEHYIN